MARMLNNDRFHCSSFVDVINVEMKQTCKVSGLSVMLVKRRLSILLKRIKAYDICWDVFLEPTTKNKAMHSRECEGNG